RRGDHPASGWRCAATAGSAWPSRPGSGIDRDDQQPVRLSDRPREPVASSRLAARRMSVTVSLGSITFGGGPDGDGDRFTVRDLPGWTGASVELVSVEKPISNGAVISVGRYKGRALSI